jgi:hypothetical protein
MEREGKEGESSEIDWSRLSTIQRRRRRRYNGGEEEMGTYSATLLDTLVPLVLRATLNLLPDILDVSYHVFPVVSPNSVLDTGIVVLLLLLARADSANSLARAGRGKVGEAAKGRGYCWV